MNYYDTQQMNNVYNRGGYNPSMNNSGWIPQQNIIQEPPIIVIPVNGEQMARNYPIEKGRTVLLFDSENHRFWIKTIKPNGLESSCEGHSFISDTEADQKMRQNQQQAGTIQMNQEDFQNKFVTREEFDMLKKSIDELIK